MIELRDYQKTAVEKICDFFNSDKHKAKLYLSTGVGKTAIIVSALQVIISNKSNISIAILTSRHEISNQTKSLMMEVNVDISIASSIKEFSEQKVLITTYQDVIKSQSNLSAFDLVICDEAHFIKIEEHMQSLFIEHTKFLGVLQQIESSDNWFNDSECLFSYMIQDAVRDGYSIYVREREFIQRFFIKLLNYQGYINILNDVKISGSNKNLRPDIIAEKNKETVVIEVKAYRGIHNSKVIINNALRQILDYKKEILLYNKNKKFTFIIVLPCEIDEKVKSEIYEQFDVIIWDIGNLIYLCEENKELLQLLFGNITYSSMNLKAKKPLGSKNDEKIINILSESEDHSSDHYIEELKKCKPGKSNKADKKYESICTNIIKYLFGTEFYRTEEQYNTGDEMFRMDLLCSLKGTTEFWRFLISFYKTKFVVFEYKNYSDFIPQNLIYITEKYLFPVALRNVAFIISRRGFDSNAEAAALGCLRENGKLIISITDEDLVKMLVMKKNGEEPSDYLLDKVEQFLMSVSK
ncbi:MAG: DEAD/DEAH box helicase family protein [Oscillospiraceae bacterium]|nr:DEAD/DEAH box helicase family protein [Oscillospiraceae bacterium]